MIKFQRTASEYIYKFPDGTTARIWRNDDRSTSWYGQWMVQRMNRSETFVISYSDPIPTLRACREAVEDMLMNPQTYELPWTWVGCTVCLTSHCLDSRLIMDNGADFVCEKCQQARDGE
jgi:hypothetical protein